MKANVLLPVILLTLGFSCNTEDISSDHSGNKFITDKHEDLKTKNTNTCSVTSPLIDLDWLASEIEELQNHSFGKSSYITQALYMNETVFILQNCCITCNTIVPFRNCSGEQIGILGYGKEYIGFDLIENKQTLWISEDSDCN